MKRDDFGHMTTNYEKDLKSLELEEEMAEDRKE